MGAGGAAPSAEDATLHGRGESFRTHVHVDRYTYRNINLAGTVLAFAFPTEKRSSETTRVSLSPSPLSLDKPREAARALGEASAEPVSFTKPHSSS